MLEKVFFVSRQICKTTVSSEIKILVAVSVYFRLKNMKKNSFSSCFHRRRKFYPIFLLFSHIVDMTEEGEKPDFEQAANIKFFSLLWVRLVWGTPLLTSADP